MKRIEKEFEQIAAFIRARRNGAIGFLNYAAVSTYWTVGAYISTRVKSKAWGMGSVLALCDYLKTRHPKIRGFGQRQIYNMVEFYDTFSSAEFDQIHSRLKLDDFIVGYLPPAGGSEVLQSPTAKRKEADRILLQLPSILKRWIVTSGDRMRIRPSVCCYARRPTSARSNTPLIAR